MTWAYVLRPREMATFRRCRRAWDFGARIRLNYVPAVPHRAPPRVCPVPGQHPGLRERRPDGLAVHRYIQDQEEHHRKQSFEAEWIGLLERHGIDFDPAKTPNLSPAVRGVPERVYVPNSDSGTVSEIDPRTFRVVRTFPTGTYDQHITPSWNLRRLYVNNMGSSTLTEIDTHTGRVIRVIRTGIKPHGLAYFPQPGRFSIGHNGVYR